VHGGLSCLLKNNNFVTARSGTRGQVEAMLARQALLGLQ